MHIRVRENDECADNVLQHNTKNRSYPKRWEKILDVMLSKGRGMMLGKLRTITLIEADLQCIMRMFLNEGEEEMIEADKRFSKANYGSRKNYSIETALLEKKISV